MLNNLSFASVWHKDFIILNQLYDKEKMLVDIKEEDVKHTIVEMSCS